MITPVVITVDEVEQSLLYDSVTSEDVGSVVAAESVCGTFPFTLGKVLHITLTTVSLQIYTQHEGDLKGIWSLSKTIKREFSKSLIFKKKIRFSNNGKLKKSFTTYLTHKYHL